MLCGKIYNSYAKSAQCCSLVRSVHCRIFSPSPSVSYTEASPHYYVWYSSVGHIGFGLLKFYTQAHFARQRAYACGRIIEKSFLKSSVALVVVKHEKLAHIVATCCRRRSRFGVGAGSSSDGGVGSLLVSP